MNDPTWHETDPGRRLHPESAPIAAEKALLHAHARLQRTVESNVIGITIGNKNGDVLEANDYYLQLIGYSRTDLRNGRVRWRDITPPEHIPTDEKAIQDLERFGACPPYEKEYIRKDGSRIWVLIVITVQEDQEDQIIAFVLDINERKLAEQILRENERKFRDLYAITQRQAQELALLDKVRTALSRELDLDIILRIVVEAIAHTFDYQLVSLYLLKGDYLDLIHQVGYERVIQTIPLGHGITSRAIRDGKPILLEDVRTDPTFLGAIEGIVSEIALPLFHQDEVVGVLNVESTQGIMLTEDDLRMLVALGDTVDIAFQRAKLFDEIREREERFRTSVETLLDGFAILSAVRDMSGKIVDFRYEYINDAGCRLNKRPRHEHIDHTFMELDMDAIHEYIHLVETRESISKETMQTSSSQDGNQYPPRIVDIRAVKLGDGFAVTWRDITERRKMELAEREQRILAEALTDSTAALNSTLHLNEVFDRILFNVGKVVPHENANIMLVEDGVARIVGSVGYTEPALQALESIRLPVVDTASFQHMSETGEPFIVTDTHNQANWVDVPESRWIRSYAGAPIRVKGKTVGFINLNATVPGHFKDDHLKRLQSFAHQAGVAVENAQLYAQTQQLAITDELTGIFNRRGLFELGRREVERSLRFGHPLSCLMVDIDNFKVVNDNYGHKVGDQVLQHLTARCLVNVREIDIFGRYGGEEFLILLPESPVEDACLVADRLRRLVAEEPFHMTVGEIPVTISIGVAAVERTGEDLFTLIDRADQALYAAKQSGRNRVESK